MIEPILEGDFANQSYGFRPRRSAQQALARVEELLKSGKIWIVDADVSRYFDTIPRDRLVKKMDE